MTLTFDLLTLNMCGWLGIMWSIYVPNLSEIGQYAAELLMINDRSFVRFYEVLQYRNGCLKNAWSDLH